MPATAGRVRMPHNNRVSSSSALKMTGIWTKTIGYDPYAAENAETGVQKESDNAYEQAQGLLTLAKLSNQGNSEKRGACKKCGMVGHLSFQCRNHLQLNRDDGKSKDEVKNDSSSLDDDDDDISSVTLSEGDVPSKLPLKRGRGFEEDAESKKRKRSVSSERKKKKKSKSKKSKSKSKKKKKSSKK